MTDDELVRLRAENARLRAACTKINDEVSQTLGRALGYPWFKDDQANFPDADEATGVCVGDHVAESLAAEAAARLVRLEAERDRFRALLERVKGAVYAAFDVGRSDDPGESFGKSSAAVLLRDVLAALADTTNGTEEAGE